MYTEVYVDTYGRFRFDAYSAEHVDLPSEPIVVVAYQDEVHQATTRFWEPDLTLLAWNIKDPTKPSNSQRWMKGDIKGYNEGDSAAMRVDISAAAAGGPGKWINFTVAIDYIDGITGFYGFDGLTRMWSWTGQVPNAPFNIYSNDSAPFWVDPAEGSITWQGWLENAYPSSSDNVLEQKWGFNLTVLSDATVRFGAHLAVTNIPGGIYGASFYSGSSLHVRIHDFETNFATLNEGNMDVPFAINTILTPPEMHLEKFVDDQEVVEGQIITFTIHFNNTGQAEAQCVNIWDNLPFVADIIPGSFLYWTNSNPPLPPVPGPTIVDPQHWSWFIGHYPGTGVDSRNPVTESYLTFQALVNTSEEGCYKNWVYLNYTDDHGGEFPQLSAWAPFCIKGEPSIDVEKTGPLYAHVNETITYMITVTNDGKTNLTDVDVVDDVLGVIASDISLAKGETRFFNVTYTIGWLDPDPLTNNVTATGVDKYGREVNDTANHTVDILHPEIVVTKSATKSCAEIGEKVWYTITVRNPSHDTDLYNVSVDDDLLDFHWSVLEFGAGEWEEFPLEITVSEDHDDPLENIVTAIGEDITGFDVDDEANWTVDILHPMVIVSKFANLSCAAIGESVTYWVNVSNPSNDTPMRVYLNDTLEGPLFAGWLLPGQYVNISYQYLLEEGDPTILINEARVVAYDRQGHYVNVSACWVLDVVHPGVEITKKADLPCAGVGDKVNFTINVTNPSWTDVWLNGTIFDPLLGLEQDFTDLKPGEWIELVIDYTVKEDDGLDGPLTNVAWVEAHDHQEHLRTARAQVVVDVVHPDIMITKSANLSCAGIGENITYTITVANPAWTDVWMNGTVYDVMLGLEEDFTDLMPGHSITWKINYTVKPSDGLQGPLRNIATVEAYDHQEHLLVNESEEVLVDVVHPDVVVTKEASKECAQPGELVTYWINVTNPVTADVWLNGTARDDVVNLYWNFFNLTPGETANFTFSYPMPRGMDTFTNLVEVQAYDHQWHYLVREASVTVDVVHPDIEITKSVNTTCAAVGENVTYNITVTNPSWTDVWMNGTVFDPLLGWTWNFTNLTPGTSISKTKSYNVSDDYSEHWLENLAWVEAYDHQKHLRVNRTVLLIEILHPEIEVTKIGPERARVGSWITYNVTVTNAGDTDLYDVVVYDSLFVAPIAFFPVLLIGETKYVNYTFQIPSGEGPLDNKANATGHDKQDVWVEDNATWTVLKYAVISGYIYADLDEDEAMDGGEPGLYNWLVVLTGTTAGGDPVVNSTHSGSDGYYEFIDLEPGTYTVTEVLEPDWYNISRRISLPIVLVSGGSESFDVGNLPYVNITGCKWADMDFDGIKDPGEMTIPGWNISLDGVDINGDDVNLTTQTGPDGCYSFLMLLPGVYDVSEEVPPGWLNITPSKRHVDVGSLEPANITHIDFGNVKLGTIYGFKFRDDNTNGYRDGSNSPGNQNGMEPLLPGWVIELTGELNNGSAFGPVYDVTDENGEYRFDGLYPGTYVIREIMKPGWTHITPDNYTVTMVSGGYFHCGKFGNLQYGSIQGWKFIDWDMDGIMDTNEPGIEGWNVTLTGWLNDGSPPGSPLDATPVGPITIQTDATGYWNFSNLLPGWYVVTEETRTYWFNVTDSQVGFLINSGTHVVDVKFGNVPYTCIWGYKFNDIDGDGVNDTEPGLSWLITLEGTTGAGKPVVIEMLTGQDGYFATCFVVLPGLYVLYELLDDDWLPTTPSRYLIDLREVMEPGKIYREFGNFELGKITGYKYEDMDGDGVRDPEDLPIPGWNVTLSNGTATWITATDGTGKFEFTGVRAGTYLLWEENRTNWVHTNSSVVWGIVITSGACNDSTVFLNTELSIIWGYKFEDLNSNGIWDRGEPGVYNWTIYLWWDGVPVISTKTNADGYYEFPGLMPAPCMVWEDDDVNWTHTNLTWESFTLVSGTERRIHDFGNFHNVKICIWKFEDVNGNERLDEGDLPLPDWEFTITGPAFQNPLVVTTNETGRVCIVITKAGQYNVSEEQRQGWVNTTPSYVLVDVTSGLLLRPLKFGNFELVRFVIKKFYDANVNGRDDAEPGLDNWEIVVQPLGITLFTETDGYVTLDGLRPGTYVVSEVVPPGWKNTTPSVLTVGPLSSGQVVQLSFGNVILGNVTGCKFYDKDMDGVWDIGEPKLAGWTIHLDGVTDWGGVVVNRTTTTNATGCYAFEGVQPGVYWVTEELKSVFWVNTTMLSQEVDVSGVREEFSEVRDFGNMRYSLVYGYKFLDTYSERFPYWPNGVFDDDEHGLGNWRITLEGRTETGVLVSKVKFTNSTDECLGFYLFSKLLPGTYWVNETLLDGFWATTPFANLIRIYADPTTPVVMRIDFGNLLPEPDPEIPFVLGKGWNLWSSPLVMSSPLYASGLASVIGPNLIKISRLNTATGKYEAFVPDVTTPGSALDFEIRFGVGYYVVVKEETYFTLTGTLVPTSTVQLVKGWNIVGYNEMAPMKASQFVGLVQGCTVYKVSYLDSATGKYYAYLPGVSTADKDFTMTPGRAYFVVTSAPGTVGFGS